MFKIGDLVRIDESERIASDMPESAAGLLVVNEYDPPWMGIPRYELKNSDGDLFSVEETALVAV
jgi:hypothetical protein